MALIVATKLKLTDFRHWIENELNGYKQADTKIPPYRHITSEIKAFNPYRGYIPVIFPDADSAKLWSAARVQNPISELEEMGKGGPTQLAINFSPEALKLFTAGTNEPEMIPRKFIGSNQITGIVDMVRTTILQWALRLEEDGILGANMSFSETEKNKAAVADNIHIGSFHGVLGNVTAENVQIGDYAAIHEQLKAAGVPQAERNDLENIIDELKRTRDPAERKTVVQRGMDWLGRNAKTIGALGTIVKGWLLGAGT